MIEISLGMEESYKGFLREIEAYGEEVYKAYYEGFDVEDCVIRTDEYALDYFDKYMKENEERIEKIPTRSDESKKEELQRIAESNSLVRKARDNISDIRNESLDAVLALKDIDIVNKEEYIASAYRDQITLSLSTNIVPVFKNTLNKKLFPEFDARNPKHFYISVDVYSSISKRKRNEFFLRNDCTMIEFFDAVDCIVCQLDKQKYNRFLWLNSSVIMENDTLKLNTSDVLFNRGSYVNRNKLDVKEARTTLVQDLHLQFNQVYILRDNLNCDHYVVFTNLVVSDILNHPSDKRLLRVFLPVLKRRKCHLCEDQKASYIIRLLDEETDNIAFTCKDCYFNLFTDQTDKLTHFNHEIYDYKYEE